MDNPKYTVHALTPQEFKEAVVKWLNAQAIIHRSNARMARTVRWEKENNDKADTLEYAAKFIYEMVIEPSINVVPPSWITHPWNADAERDYSDKGSPAITKVDINLGLTYWIKRERIIEAIKCYRYHTNVGLLDAKNYVEKLKNDLTFSR